MKYAATTVQADGESAAEEWMGTYDGKDFPFVGVPDFDSRAVKAIAATKAEFTLKKGGKIIGGTRVISKDSKVMTITVN